MARPADEEMITTENVVRYIHRYGWGVHAAHGGPHWKVLGLVRRQREKGKLGARAFIVVSVGQNRRGKINRFRMG